MFTKFKTSESDKGSSSIRTIRFRELEPGDIFVTADFAKPLIKTFVTWSPDRFFNPVNTISLVDKKPLWMHDDQPVSVFNGEIELLKYKYITTKDDIKD